MTGRRVLHSTASLSEGTDTRINLVASYFTDLAHLRDRMLGAQPSDFHPPTVADRVEAWLRRHALSSAARDMESVTTATPDHFRALLVGASVAHDPIAVERVLFATELLAVGTAVHDSVGSGRPRAPIPDRQLVLVGDVLLSRAVAQINRGGPELAWFIEHAFERLVVNQFRYSTEEGSGSIGSWEAATREGSGLLTYAAVRSCALTVGDDENAADVAGRAATELAMAMQLIFDIQHPTRRVEGGIELNSRSAIVLAARRCVDDVPVNATGFALLTRASDRSLQKALCDRARQFIERALAVISGGQTQLEEVLRMTVSRVSAALVRAEMQPSGSTGGNQ